MSHRTAGNPDRRAADRSREEGLSLAEVLVALAVTAIAGMAALLLYDAARKSFHKGENATEQQQAVRIAFDRVSRDIRLTGFNAHPDGDADDTDESIEAAYDTAVVTRADFDAEDSVESAVPEGALAGGARRTVSVGNDEVVAYVLAKPDGTSPDTLTFEADVKDVPRDGAVEVVRIPNVALVQNAPPYTLYRITLNNDVGTWGARGFLVKTPLLENVRSMTFRYHGARGPLNGTFDLGRLSDDIGGGDTPSARRVRSAIRWIEVDIEGLTRDPDLSYTDAADPNPETRRYRKFRLHGEAAPRNLGRRGLQDLGWDVTPPARPAAPTLVKGHCQGMLVLWTPNPSADGVVAYQVNYGAAPGRRDGRVTTAASPAYLNRLADGTAYYVSIQAVDSAGNWSLPSEERSEVVVNANAPEPPLDVQATDGEAGEIVITWSPVVNNLTSQPPGDPDAPRIRDLEGYRILRGSRADFAVGDPDTVVVAREDETGPMPVPSFKDTNVVACRRYYYRVLAADFCDTTNDTGVDAPGRGAATARPRTPEGAWATSSGGTVRLVWEPVTRDEAGQPVFVGPYDVERCSGAGCVLFATPGEGVAAFDDVAPVPGATYRVRARNDCPANGTSDWSAAVSPSCSFSGEVRITIPGPGSVRTPVDLGVGVSHGTDTYDGATLDIRDEVTGETQTVPLSTPGPSWSYRFSPPAPGRFTLLATVTNGPGGCRSFASVRFATGR